MTCMMNDLDIIRIECDRCVVDVVRSEEDLVMTDRIVRPDDRLAAPRADQISVLIDALGPDDPGQLDPVL